MHAMLHEKRWWWWLIRTGAGEAEDGDGEGLDVDDDDLEGGVGGGGHEEVVQRPFQAVHALLALVHRHQNHLLPRRALHPFSFSLMISNCSHDEIRTLVELSIYREARGREKGDRSLWGCYCLAGGRVSCLRRRGVWGEVGGCKFKERKKAVYYLSELSDQGTN